MSIDLDGLNDTTIDLLRRHCEALALRHAAETDAALAADHDGVIYEDGYVIIERHAGRVFTTGKQFREVLMYDKVGDQ